MPLEGGDIVERRRIVARLLWDVAAGGEAVLPNGEKLEFSPRDWLEVVKFLYSHIDGPVKPQTPGESSDKPSRATARTLDELENLDALELLQLYREEAGEA